MRGPRVPIELDLVTDRLVALAVGVGQANLIDSTTAARRLIGLARGVRSFAVAGEHDLAVVALADIHDLAVELAGADDDDPLPDVLVVHVTRILARLNVHSAQATLATIQRKELTA